MRLPERRPTAAPVLAPVLAFGLALAAFAPGRLGGQALAQVQADDKDRDRAADGPADKAPLVRDAVQRYELRLGSGWTSMGVAQGAKVPLVGYQHARSGALLSISRVDYPNAAAWKRKSRDAYYAEIERGLRDAAPGYERVDMEALMLGSVPALDVTFRRSGRAGREVVLFRILLFRQYSLAMALSMPEREHRAYRTAHSGVRKSFVPYFAQDN